MGLTAKSQFNLVTQLSSLVHQFQEILQALIALSTFFQEAGAEVIHGKVNNIHILDTVLKKNKINASLNEA